MKDSRLEALTKQAGGRFRLTSLLQKRLQELLRGSPKLIEEELEDPIEIVMREAEEGRVQLILPPSAEREPEPPKSTA